MWGVLPPWDWSWTRRCCPGSQVRPAFLPQASRQVFLLKLTPGLDPSIFDILVDLGYRGIVIEAFGLGGMHFLHRNPGRGIRAQWTGGSVWWSAPSASMTAAT